MSEELDEAMDTLAETADGRMMCENQEEGDCEEIEFVSDVVLFTFFMLLLGLVTKNLLRKVPIPYTALLLILGLGFGFIHGELRPDPREGCKSRLEGRTEDDSVWRRGYQHLGKGIEAWTSIEPELLLLIHLPALIFASAFTLDFHITKRNFMQILILAGPGVAIGTGLTAVVAKYVFPYDWCWPKALMFGAMLSATDPVAVVALLKEVGASAILGTVIEGESLFNDGTAFVFFLLFRDLIRWTTSCNNGECHNAYRIECSLCACDELEPIEGELGGEGRRLLASEEGPIPICDDFRPAYDFAKRDVGGSFRFFARMALGAPVIGAGFGLAASFWINFVFNDMVVEVAITFVTAYLCYYTAEDLLSMSGVLSVVSLGMVMTVFAKPRLSPKVHEPMEVFWEMVEYFANTMIFVYSGVKIAIVLWENAIELDEGKEKFIRGDEWGWAILLYVMLQVIRLVTIVLCYPFMIMSGYKIHWKEAIVMIWGGLRGAVGLALSLIVNFDEERLDPKFRALVIFYMGVMAALTLIVNGTSMPYLLSALGVTDPKPENLEVLLHVVKELEAIEDAGKESVDEHLGEPDMTLVKKLTKLNVSSVIPSDRAVCSVMRKAATNSSPAALELEEHLAANKELSKENGKEAESANPLLAAISRIGLAKKGSKFSFRHKSCRMPEVITVDMLVRDFRARVLRGVKSAYGEMNEIGELDAEQHFNLKESADEALDKVDKPLSDWKHLERVLSLRGWRRLVQFMESGYKELTLMKFARPLGSWLDWLFFVTLEHSAILAMAFILAHEEAAHALHEYLEFVQKEQDENKAEKEAAMVVEDASSQVLNESNKEREDAIHFLKNMRHAYPEVVLAIKSKRTAWEVLQRKLEYVEGVGKSGLVEKKEAQALTSLVEQKLKKLVYHPPKAELPKSKDLLQHHPLFQNLDPEAFDREVWPHAKLKLYALGDSIFELGRVAETLSLVIRGVVRLECPGTTKFSRQMGSGAMIGVSEVILKEQRSRSLVAETIAEVFEIDADVFRDVVAKHVEVRKRAWQMAGAFLTMQNPWGMCKGKTYEELQTIFRQSEVVECVKDETFKVTQITYLAFGKMREFDSDVPNKGIVEAPTPLTVGTMFVCMSEEAKLLALPAIRAGPRLNRLSTLSLGRANLLRRQSVARISQRPSVLTRVTSMGREATIPLSHSITPETSAPLDDIIEGQSFKVTASGGGVARSATLAKAESEPQWRLEQAVGSAGAQQEREAARGRPRVERSSTGIVPSSTRYKAV